MNCEYYEKCYSRYRKLGDYVIKMIREISEKCDTCLKDMERRDKLEDILNEKESNV